MTGQHPHTEQVYAALRGSESIPLLPREYGLQVVSAVLRLADHIHATQQAEREK